MTSLDDVDDGFFGDIDAPWDHDSEWEAMPPLPTDITPGREPPVLDYDSEWEAMHESQVLEDEPGCVVVQPPSTWFQFGEGPIRVVVDLARGVTLERPPVELCYADSHGPVASYRARPPVRVLDQETHGSRVTFTAKVGEISRNHRSRKFCLCIQTSHGSLLTDGFVVKTKRTKRKQLGVTTPVDDRAYKRQAQSLLKEIQWTIVGYRNAGCNDVDLSSPIYACPVCKGRKTSGHTNKCPLQELLID